MFFLVANVIFATIFVLTIKWVQLRGREDVITVGAINYIVAAVAFFPEFLFATSSVVSTAAVATGLTMGLCYFVAYFFVVRAVQWIGASAATVISALSLLVPIVCGIAIWNESPNRMQVIGIGLALFALALMGARVRRTTIPNDPIHGRGDAYPAWFVPTMLALFFALCGCSRLSQEAFKHLCQPPHRPTFIVTAFTTAAIPSLILLFFRRKRVLFRELAFGSLMGIANVLQTHFILKSLDQFDGFIVFPAVGAGGLILTAVVATGLMGESLGRKTKWSIAIACGALVLLNWGPSG